jgi:hypothetical protein
MKLSSKIVLLLLTLSLTFCSRRYKMHNMLSEEIDVTHFIESRNYLPDCCDGRLDRLFRTQPASYQIDTVSLKHMIAQWAIDNHIESAQGLTYSSLNYRYTYFITNDPINVYSIIFQLYMPAPEDFRLFFRIDHSGKLISGLSKEGWVINGCDEE